VDFVSAVGADVVLLVVVGAHAPKRVRRKAFLK
jgi:hypothetical protein